MQPEETNGHAAGAASLELMLANGMVVAANTDAVQDDPWWLKAKEEVEKYTPKKDAFQRFKTGSVMTYRQMLAMEWPETPWLIEGVVEAGPTIFAIIGAPKACKSWLGVEMALAVASGENLFGSVRNYKVSNTPRRAVVVNAENSPKNLRRRMRALEVAKVDDNHTAKTRQERMLDHLLYFEKQPMNLLDDRYLLAFVAEMLFTASTGKIDLLILDPLRDLFDIEDEQSATEMGRAMDRLRIIAQILQCPVGIVHHAKKTQGKQETNVREMARGSSAFVGKVDAAIGMGNPRGPSKQHFIQDMFIITRDGQAAEPCTLSLVVEDDSQMRATKATWIVEPLDERGNANKPAKEQRATGLKQEVLSFLRSATRPYGSDAIAVEIGRAKVNVSAVVKELADANEIEQGRVGRITGWSIRGRATPPLNGVETADQG